MAASPQQSAGISGIEIVRVGAQAQLPAAVRQLPEGGGGLDPLHLPEQGGELLAVRLRGTHLFYIPERGGADDHLALLIVVGALEQAALQLQPLAAFRLEAALVDLFEKVPVLHQLGGDPVGGGGGVAVDKAAAVGGDGQIQGLGNLPVHDLQPLSADAVDHLTAGGGRGVQAEVGGVALIGGMVVDAELRLALIPRKLRGKQILRGNVHRHNVLRHIVLRGKIGLNIPQIGGGDP